MLEDMNANKQKALAALAEGKSITAAAKAAGVSRPTLYAWRRDRDFRRALRQAREAEAVEHAEALARTREAAIDVIKEIMLDGTQPGQTRLNAAYRLLQADGNAQARLAKLVDERDSPPYWLV